MSIILTGRYNHETWEASLLYRKRKQIPCIYAPPVKISQQIDINENIFVVEMNNSSNQIMGIGLIKNKLVTDKKHKVQSDTNCNRYIYIGKYHISREILEDYDKELVDILDIILFKGYTHSKRGYGLTRIPSKVLKQDICKKNDILNKIKTVFVKYFYEK